MFRRIDRIVIVGEMPVRKAGQVEIPGGLVAQEQRGNGDHHASGSCEDVHRRRVSPASRIISIFDIEVAQLTEKG